jgi:hypothetical protein
MTPPEFTPIKATGQRHATTEPHTWWNANIENGARIILLPRPTGYRIVVKYGPAAGESYGIYPTLESAYLEACDIHTALRIAGV